MFESIAVIVTYLLVVLIPVLIPAIIHVVHAVGDWRQASVPLPVPRLPRFAAPRRPAVA